MKTCTKCGEAKPKVEFRKEKTGKGGLRAQCRACGNAANADYRAANPEKVSAYNANWRAENPDKQRAANRTWRDANPDKVNASSAAWRAENLEKKRAANRTWQKANREKVSARSAAWNKANPEKASAAVAAWAKANPDKRRTYIHNYRARKQANGGTLSPDIVEIKMKAQGGLCTCCGMPLTEWHIDHSVPLSRGGPNTDDNAQLLLPRCNQSKGTKTMDEYMRAKKEVHHEIS